MLVAVVAVVPINLASDLASRPRRAMDVDVSCAGTHGPDQFVYLSCIQSLIPRRECGWDVRADVGRKDGS